MSVYRRGVEAHPLYTTWINMKSRCVNRNHSAFKHYGGKGITVCERWKGSFKAFCDDMGERPIGHTLDRIQSHLGYSPDNCRWADKLTQGQNRERSDKRDLVNLHGVIISVGEAADFLGVPRTSAYREYRRTKSLAKYLK